MIMITPAEFEDEMRRIAKKGDLDEAITLMCEALIDNGYSSGIKILADMRNSSKKQSV